MCSQSDANRYFMCSQVNIPGGDGTLDVSKGLTKSDYVGSGPPQGTGTYIAIYCLLTWTMYTAVQVYNRDINRAESSGLPANFFCSARPGLKSMYYKIFTIV